MADSQSLFDGHGRRVAVFHVDQLETASETAERLVLVGDYTGDGVPDLLLTTEAMTALYIFKNEQGRKPARPTPLGSDFNITLY